jgi:hypothetical protein
MSALRLRKLLRSLRTISTMAVQRGKGASKYSARVFALRSSIFGLGYLGMLHTQSPCVKSTRGFPSLRDSCRVDSRSSLGTIRFRLEGGVHSPIRIELAKVGGKHWTNNQTPAHQDSAIRLQRQRVSGRCGKRSLKSRVNCGIRIEAGAGHR